MPNQLLDVLLAEGLISQDQYLKLQEEIERSGESALKVVETSRLVEEEKLAEIKGKTLGVSYINLIGRDIPVDVLNIISRDVAENYQAISFERVDNVLGIGLVDPKNFRAIEAMEFLAKEQHLSVEFYIISLSSFKDAVKKYEILKKEVEKALELARERFVPEEKKEAEAPIEEEVIKRAPVSKMVSMIMRYAVENKASDIHIEPGPTESRVRYRIDGVLRSRLALPKYIHPAVIARIKVLANLKIDETRIPQDGRIRQNIAGRDVDFRISTLPLIDNEKVVMRVLETGAAVASLEDLGFRKKSIEIIVKNIRKPHGLFLITGPTGSGKSTTLYTALTLLNKEGTNIVTLEDPIEYFIKGVNQSQIKPEIGFTFATGLRALLRQDPNIIMVGEIRDNETAELAIHAALTGHLIFSTLHTNDALGAVPRLTDMKVEPFLLSSTLNAIAAQRLVRRICKDCKEKVEVPKDVEAVVRSELALMPKEAVPAKFRAGEPLTFWRGKGCARCGGEGYKGRLVISEILETTENLQSIIARGFNIDEAREEIKRQGIINLKQDGILKVLGGLTTIEEVMRATQE